MASWWICFPYRRGSFLETRPSVSGARLQTIRSPSRTSTHIISIYESARAFEMLHQPLFYSWDILRANGNVGPLSHLYRTFCKLEAGFLECKSILVSRYVKNIEGMTLGDYVRPCEVCPTGKSAQVWFLGIVMFQGHKKMKYSWINCFQLQRLDEIIDIITRCMWIVRNCMQWPVSLGD